MSNTLNISKEQMMDLDNDMNPLSWEDDYNESDSENDGSDEDLS